MSLFLFHVLGIYLNVFIIFIILNNNYYNLNSGKKLNKTTFYIEAPYYYSYLQFSM